MADVDVTEQPAPAKRSDLPVRLASAVIMLAVAIGLTFVSKSWWVWTGLLIAMILAIGPHHPPTLDDELPVGNTRVLLAAVALAILIVCFTPAPIGEFVGAR